jgi:hypothetical protein
MTEDELTQLDALAQAATPGPWITDETDVMRAYYPDHLEGYADIPVCECFAHCENDAAYIAAACNAAPGLIADVRKLREALREVQGKSDRWNHDYYEFHRSSLTPETLAALKGSDHESRS